MPSHPILPCLAALLLVPAGCAAPGGSLPPAGMSHEERVVAADPHAQRILGALRAAGHPVRPATLSRAEFLREAPGYVYRIDDEWLHLHVYPTPEAAAAMRAKVLETSNTTMITWVAPPHFYQCGRLGALYLGTRLAVERVIEEVCGAPINVGPHRH